MPQSPPGLLFPWFVAALLAACGPPGNATPASQPNIVITPLRGIIEQLPTPDAPRTLTIRHELTQDMPSMTMPFTLGPAVPLTGLSVGDKISFRYEIDLTPRLEHVTQIQKLPPDTVLNFGPATTTP